ncbi:DNA polymerase III subunit delta [Derxia gummosa]|uniref:DNA polymerase III subunit delta n=1 Tax=Derxia gummosa DSM 723 TaxID=1121388 RepID=A0A8B6XBY2_9BURK|nr:DNA polymerase III subunit delta [Derxia gummosa]
MPLLRLDDLPGHLAQSAKAGRLAPLYVVASGEPLLQIEAVDAIRAAARRCGYSEREVTTVGPRFDWSGFTNASSSLSLFADRKLVELRIPSGKPGKDGGQVLQAFAAGLRDDDDSLLTVITLPRADREMRDTKWFGALLNAGRVLQIEPVERPALPQWIAQRLAGQGQTTTPEALQFIADRVEGNLLAAHQEILKLGLLHPEGRLDTEAVKDAVLNVARYDVFKLSEALLGADAPRYARMLAGLEGEGAALPLVLWAVAEDLRTLWRLRTAMDAGRPVGVAMKELRIWGVREKLLPKAVARLDKATIGDAVRKCAALDKIAKGLPQVAAEEGLTGDVWADLLALGLGLMNTGGAKAGGGTGAGVHGDGQPGRAGTGAPGSGSGSGSGGATTGRERPGADRGANAAAALAALRRPPGRPGR